jgi:hypothetical protein
MTMRMTVMVWTDAAEDVIVAATERRMRTRRTTTSTASRPWSVRGQRGVTGRVWCPVCRSTAPRKRKFGIAEAKRKAGGSRAMARPRRGAVSPIPEKNEPTISLPVEGGGRRH